MSKSDFRPLPPSKHSLNLHGDPISPVILRNEKPRISLVVDTTPSPMKLEPKPLNKIVPVIRSLNKLTGVPQQPVIPLVTINTNTIELDIREKQDLNKVNSTSSEINKSEFPLLEHENADTETSSPALPFKPSGLKTLKIVKIKSPNTPTGAVRSKETPIKLLNTNLKLDTNGSTNRSPATPVYPLVKVPFKKGQTMERKLISINASNKMRFIPVTTASQLQSIGQTLLKPSSGSLNDANAKNPIKFHVLKESPMPSKSIGIQKPDSKEPEISPLRNTIMEHTYSIATNPDESHPAEQIYINQIPDEITVKTKEKDAEFEEFSKNGRKRKYFSDAQVSRLIALKQEMFAKKERRKADEFRIAEEARERRHKEKLVLLNRLIDSCKSNDTVS